MEEWAFRFIYPDGIASVMQYLPQAEEMSHVSLVHGFVNVLSILYLDNGHVVRDVGL